MLRFISGWHHSAQEKPRKDEDKDSTDFLSTEEKCAVEMFVARFSDVYAIHNMNYDPSRNKEKSQQV